MESIYTEFALYGSKSECARNDTVFLPISQVCSGSVSLENVSVLGQDNGYTVKYTPSPEGVPSGFALGNS